MNDIKNESNDSDYWGEENKLCDICGNEDESVKYECLGEIYNDNHKTTPLEQFRMICKKCKKKEKKEKIKKRDLKKGKENELKVYEYLKNNVYPKIKKSKGEFAVFDFKLKNLRIEVKSRNCYSNTYKTTIVGKNKIKYLEKYNYEGVFYFLFEDGLYRWDYNPNNPNEFYTKLGGRKDRGKKEIKKYAYIYKKYLKLITRSINSSVCLIDF